MLNFKRILLASACVGLLSSITACAGSLKHESTGQYVDNSVITTKVKAAIFKEPSLKTLQINVKTYKAVVQLSGFVDSKQSITRAGEIARGVEGVESVENDLVVK
jgi:osmotically-inducible protein OsmY